jgi:hypothetical protein
MKSTIMIDQTNTTTIISVIMIRRRLIIIIATIIISCVVFSSCNVVIPKIDQLIIINDLKLEALYHFL